MVPMVPEGIDIHLQNFNKIELRVFCCHFVTLEEEVDSCRRLHLHGERLPACECLGDFEARFEMSGRFDEFCDTTREKKSQALVPL